MIRLPLLRILTFLVVCSCCQLLSAQLVDQAAGGQWWYGELVSPGRAFRFAIQTKPDETGKWQASLKTLDEGNQTLELSNVILTEREFKFELPATKAKYSGTREPGGKEFVGQWMQGAAKVKLDFRQVDGIPQDQPNEVWLGDLVAGGQKLKLQMRIYRSDDGKTSAYFDSLSQQVGGFQAEWSATGDQIAAKVPAVNGKFAGTINAAGDSISGVWNQGAAMPLVWKKSDTVAGYEIKILRRPQHPKGKPNYRVEPVKFKNTEVGIELAGTLTYPGDPLSTQPSDKRFPVAVLISGSGPQDRDETILGHKPFLVLADHLTRAGIAVLRFDERGVGESKGQYNNATTADFASDVWHAVQFLAQHPAIDARQIGLIGHSEGGIVAPMVAAKDPSIAWIVMLAGPGVNGEQILYSQGKLIVEAAGGSESDTLRQRILQEVVFETMKSIAPEAKIDEHVQPAVDAFIKKLKAALVEGGKLKSIDEAVDFETDDARTAIAVLVRANMEQMHLPWFRFFATHEPGPVLEKVKCPVLALNGQRDVQVDPKLNLPKIEAALRAGGNTQIKTLELPELNHLFQTATTGALSEYESIEETFAPSALQVISDWILGQVKR